MARNRGWCYWGGLIPQCTLMFYVYVYFLNIFFLFFINKNIFFTFSFLFCDKTSNTCHRILTNQNSNRWSEIVSGTVYAIVLWLTSDERVYLLVGCLKLILVSRFKSNWWAQQGFGTQPNYEASGNLLVELVILLW